MNSLGEGRLASYVGEGHAVSLGSQGEVLTFAGRGAWVRWVTGSRTGQTDLVDQMDLVALGAAQPQPQPHEAALWTQPYDDLTDSLEVGTTLHTGASRIQETQGTEGVFLALVAQGSLRSLADAPQEALAVVAHRVRQDPLIREVTAQLGDDDAEQLVQYASVSLLRDALQGDLRG